MQKSIIKLVAYKSEKLCEDCGICEANCVRIESNNDKVISKTLGYADCCSPDEYSIKEAILYVLEKLNIKIDYSELTKKALLKVGEESPDIMYDDGRLSYKDMIRALNPVFKIPKGETLETFVIKLLEKENIGLLIEE